MTVDVETIEPQDYRLGRQKVHDSRSLEFPRRGTPIDRSTWRDRNIRIWDPLPNPNQCHGECTGCAEAMVLNAQGNRVLGRVLDLLTDAHRIYADASHNDPWPGGFPEEDTGSSGLAAAKAAVKFGLAADYTWNFDGADGVVQSIMDGKVQSIGTWWHADMFDPDADGRIHPTGGKMGGHQYVARGYDVRRDWVLLRCWWGAYRDVWISRTDLDGLLRDGGDSHHTRSV